MAFKLFDIGIGIKVCLTEAINFSKVISNLIHASFLHCKNIIYFLFEMLENLFQTNDGNQQRTEHIEVWIFADAMVGTDVSVPVCVSFRNIQPIRRMIPMRVMSSPGCCRSIGY